MKDPEIDPAESEIMIGFNNPDCLDSMEDLDDENDCEARRCQREALDEVYDDNN